jgi:hypothetical protein
MSTEPTSSTPSLFPDEWRARFGAELQQLLDEAPTSDRDTIEAQFLQTHPPIFQGVYTAFIPHRSSFRSRPIPLTRPPTPSHTRKISACSCAGTN